MEYFDEEILEARRELERLKHTTLETGIYVGDELITFTNITLLPMIYTVLQWSF
jgi:hypothetical protein